MKRLNDLYDYGLKIYQDDEYFKFSLDSILLAEFVKIKNGMSVLDIGTGSAPIPLILSTKAQNLYIDVLELQKEIFDLAVESVEINKLRDVIQVHNVRAQDYNCDKKYDVITCNPPYFKVTNTSQKNENKIKMIARHECMLSLFEVIEIAKKNIKPNGSFYLVHRVDRLIEAIMTLKELKFGVRKIVIVKSDNKEYAEMFLLEASPSKKDDLKIKTINVGRNESYKGILE